MGGNELIPRPFVGIYKVLSGDFVVYVIIAGFYYVDGISAEVLCNLDGISSWSERFCADSCTGINIECCGNVIGNMKSIYSLGSRWLEDSICSYKLSAILEKSFCERA